MDAGFCFRVSGFVGVSTVLRAAGIQFKFSTFIRVRLLLGIFRTPQFVYLLVASSVVQRWLTQWLAWGLYGSLQSGLPSGLDVAYTVFHIVAYTVACKDFLFRSLIALMRFTGGLNFGFSNTHTTGFSNTINTGFSNTHTTGFSNTINIGFSNTK